MIFFEKILSLAEHGYHVEFSKGYMFESYIEITMSKYDHYKGLCHNKKSLYHDYHNELLIVTILDEMKEDLDKFIEHD